MAQKFEPDDDDFLLGLLKESQMMYSITKIMHPMNTKLDKNWRKIIKKADSQFMNDYDFFQLDTPYVDNKTESESRTPCLHRVYILINTDFKCILYLLNRSFIFIFKSYKILKGTKLRMVTILSLENSCLLMMKGFANHLQTK